MIREENLAHALKLARENLMFLMNYNNIPTAYLYRALHTIEFIGEKLGDKEEIEPWLQKWINEGEWGTRMRLVLKEVRKQREKDKIVI